MASLKMRMKSADCSEVIDSIFEKCSVMTLQSIFWDRHDAAGISLDSTFRDEVICIRPIFSMIRTWNDRQPSI